jgi:hypothetical protein
MGKEIFVKNSGGAVSAILRAFLEDMRWVATVHAAGKASRVCANKSGDGVSGVGGETVGGCCALITTHGLFSG